MGFPPALWFGDVKGEGRTPDDALLATLDKERPPPLLFRLQLKIPRVA
jgi:hypothetical protein